MNEYIVGPGVAEAIAANGDTPRSDEQYIVMAPGRQISVTFADQGIYYWYEEVNRVSRTPF